MVLGTNVSLVLAGLLIILFILFAVVTYRIYRNPGAHPNFAKIFIVLAFVLATSAFFLLTYPLLEQAFRNISIGVPAS